MASFPSSRVLVSGEVGGKWAVLVNTLTKLQQKSGPFDLLLCCGNFFGEGEKEGVKGLFEYLETSPTISVPVYFAVSSLEDLNQVKEAAYSLAKKRKSPTNTIQLTSDGTPITEPTETPIPTGQIEIYPNLVCLGSDGFRRVGKICLFLCCHGSPLSPPISGLEEETSFPPIDIFLSWNPPEKIFHGLPNSPLAKLAPEQKEVIDKGCVGATQFAIRHKPRYHFSSLKDTWFERPPYLLVDSGKRYITRFFSIAQFGNKEKQKYIYAMKLTHEDNATNALPQNASLVQGTTPCPFAHRSPNYQQQQHQDRKRRRDPQPHEARKRAPPAPSGPPPSCWFCLDSPQVEGHLITSVGSSAYLALPKGPLVPREEVLIVPIQHKASTALLEEEEKKEIRDYIAKLKECFAKKNKDILVFERYQPSRNFPNPHMHLQITPIDKEQSSLISPFFQREIEKHSLSFSSFPPSSPPTPPEDTPFLRVEVGDECVLFTPIPPSVRFPLNFGRACMASLLSVPERVDWKKCQQTKEEEESDAKHFREMFAAFDPFM